MAVAAAGLFGNTNATNTTVTSASVTPTASSTVLLVAWNFKSGGGAAAAPTISQTGITVPNGWSQLATGTANTGGTAADTRWTLFYTLLGASPGTGTVTATFAATQDQLYIRAFTLSGEIQTGTNGANAFPAANAGVATSGAASSFSYSVNALVDVNSLVLACPFIQGTSQTFTAGTGYTAYGTTVGTSSICAAERQNNTTTVAGSWTTSSNYAVVAVEIADAASGGASYTENLSALIAPGIGTAPGGGAIVLCANSFTETYRSGAGIGPTITGKTGTAGSPVMQKSAAGWTYVSQNKNASSTTPIDQKGAPGYTKVTDH